MLAANADALVTLFRSEVDDAIVDISGGDAVLLWKHAEVYAYLTEACDRLLKDTDSQYRVRTFPFAAQQAVIPLPAEILHIRQARLIGRNSPVDPANANALGFGETDDYGLRLFGTPNLFEGTGVPRRYVRDFDAQALRLVPIPMEADVLELQCTANISLPVGQGAALPTNDAEEQRLLLHFMKWKAYEKQDAETQDMVRARYYQTQYETGALKRKTDLLNQRRAPGVVRMAFP